MKLRILIVALVTALGPGCASTDKSRAALRVEPAMMVRHGAPDAQSYYQLARYYHGQRRLALAEEAYLKAIAAGGSNVNALNALASLYAERGQLDKAVQTFERALVVAPNAAYIHNNLGYAYYLQGQHEQAYAAVRKALSIDPALVRGWSNLQQIAATGPDPTLVTLVAARRLDALPLAMRLAAQSPTSVDKPSPIVAVSDPGVARAEPATSGSARVAEVVVQGLAKVRQAAETALAVLVSAAPEESAIVQVLEPQASSGKFTLVSPAGEVVLHVERSTSDPAAPIVAAQPAHREAPAHEVTAGLSALRLEVSNGNGITGFAKRFVVILRSKKLPVQRITNYESFSLAETLVEFQPGYESVANNLISRAGLDASLVPAKSAHPGWNVRIVLGRDAVEVAELQSRGGDA